MQLVRGQQDQIAGGKIIDGMVYKHPAAAGHQEIKSLLFQLLSFLGRCRNPEQSSQPLDPEDAVIQEAARYHNQFKKANIYSKNMFERRHLPSGTNVNLLTMDQCVADYVHMSPAWFSRKFHKAVGLGFKEYLTHIRLENAEKLLLTTGMSVTEIALTALQ